MNETTFTSPVANAPQAPLTLNAQSEALIVATARWSRFLGILTFIMMGLMFLSGLTLLFTASILADYADFAGMNLTLMALLYIILPMLYLFPGLFLYRYASRMRTALANRDETALTDGLLQHKKLFAFMGIYSIVAIALIILAIIIGTIVGVAMAM